MDTNKLNFLNVPTLKAFNEKVSQEVDGEKKVQPQVAFDSETFDSFIVKPDSLDSESIYELAKIIDGKTHYNKLDELPIDKTAPITVDQLDNALAIVFVAKDGIPIATATLADPTVPNFKGIVPIDQYEMKAGISLEGRLQQVFFAVSPEYHDMGIGSELRKRLSEITDKFFIVVNASDIETIEGLKLNGYKFVSEFNTDWDSESVQLWIN